MRLQLIPFRARHVPLILPEVPPEIMERALAAEKYGDGFTACLYGDPIGAAGLSMHDDNVGELWAMFSPLIKTMPVSLYKLSKQKLADVIVKHKPKEIWARACPEDEAAQRFLEHLGFRMEMFMYVTRVMEITSDKTHKIVEEIR